VISRYWRLRPIDFNGGVDDYWGVQALQMFHDYEATDIDNIQDKVFLENRDRDYADESTLVKGYYDLIDTQTELSRFGIEVPSQSFYITVSFSQCVASLGRPLVIGDIIEMPSEAQYSATMERINKYVEITDVGWSTEGYTPGWQPTMLRIVAQPAMASQETQDIFGDLRATGDISGLFDNNDGNHEKYQDYSDVSHEIQNQAKEQVPERGRDLNAVKQFSQEEIDAQAPNNITKLGQNPTGLYVEDGMPPNGESFTEGVSLPEDNVSHGDYHRLTYEDLSEDVPPRLYRYSTDKNRWVYLETDRRQQYNPAKPILQEFLTSDSRRSHTDIVDD
jgi:hypothetical protein